MSLKLQPKIKNPFLKNRKRLKKVRKSLLKHTSSFFKHAILLWRTTKLCDKMDDLATKILIF